jgi:DNA-directed DNA polymerase III PolC
MFLNTYSYFSLRYGVMSLEKLIDEALKYNIKTCALTDINNSMGMIDFAKLCKGKNIKPIAGIEFRNGNDQLYIGIAMNREGFRELNELVTLKNQEHEDYPARAPHMENVFFIYPFGKIKYNELNENEYVGIKPAGLARLVSSDFRYRQEKLLICKTVTVRNDKEHFLHCNLRAVDKNILISRLTKEDVAAPDERFVTFDELKNIYSSYPQIIANTEKIAERCNIDFDYSTIKNKKTFTSNPADDRLLLQKLAMDGLDYRYGKTNNEALKRVLHELEIIDRLGFSSYFLTTWDIVHYSMSRGFYHVGRGSGANSIVSYCLKITDVDPIELDLYFERFINPKRSSPPDFDIDYSWKDRDEVIDYIFKRYGRRHTALLGTTVTFKDKSIYRELGKVYGLPKAEIDDLVDNPEKSTSNDEVVKKIIAVARYMDDFPNIRSIHAGGILISEEPITYYSALDMPPKGFPTTQWDMYVAEDLRYEKLDILSQRGIGHIRECAEIIYQNKGISVDVHQIEKFKKDEKVKARLKDAESNGCFYIESPAMRGLLKKLRCDNYLSLVAASSIIRPGVARSGMMREYIHRFNHPDDFSYIHPVMEEQLKETYGVMVYQEDVLKICHHFAGLDLADADVLRRAMSGKFRAKNELQRIVDKFFSNCKERGYSETVTKEVWRQIESFAGYSFSKAHSASYAAESFQSLYLKTYFPLEFMVAVINNFGGFYKTWVYFNEARRCGANIMLPCVNKSNYKTNIYENDIYVGFIHIANLETTIATTIETERKKNGLYQDLSDFIKRVSPGIEQIILLIRTGAFRFTGKSKPELLWEAYLYFGKKEPEFRNASIFNTPVKTFKLPEFVHDPVEDAYDEIELIGFPVTSTYFELLKTKFRGDTNSKGLINYVGKQIKMVGLLVTIKYVRTVKHEWMHFGTFIDCNGEFFDTVHFPPSLKNYPFRGNGVYLLKGKVVEDFGFPSIEIERMAKLPIKADSRIEDQ